MPSFIADLGEVISTGRPSILISPRSGRWTPERILINVDLPAPLSPTRPHTSPGWTSRSTPLRACTPEYHLCRLRTEIKRAAISAFHFDAPCSSLQPRIGDDGKYSEPADGELEPVGVNLRQYQAVVDDTDQERTHDGAEHCTDATRQGGAADHRRRNGLQLQPVTDRGKRRAQPEDFDRSRETGQHGAHDKARH